MANFETKDSGHRSEYKSGMVRDTQDGKPRFNLMYPLDVPYSEQMLTRLAELLERGMDKYGWRNWEKADSEEELIRFKESAHRHFIQWLTGEDDEDHAAAALFNILAAETVKYKRKVLAQKNNGNRSIETGWDIIRQDILERIT
jgi:hypothetical protein